MSLKFLVFRYYFKLFIFSFKSSYSFQILCLKALNWWASLKNTTCGCAVSKLLKCLLKIWVKSNVLKCPVQCFVL